MIEKDGESWSFEGDGWGNCFEPTRLVFEEKVGRMALEPTLASAN